MGLISVKVVIGRGTTPEEAGEAMNTALKAFLSSNPTGDFYLKTGRSVGTTASALPPGLTVTGFSLVFDPEVREWVSAVAVTYSEAEG